VNDERQAALTHFTDYFVRNYPGPNTIISDPHWHAPKIFRAAEYALEQAARAASPVPAGWKLLKDSTQDERTWHEDAGHENGNYYCLCHHCGRQFVGHKRRVECKVCAMLAASPASPNQPPQGAQQE
jgi:hypothetical protein